MAKGACKCKARYCQCDSPVVMVFSVGVCLPVDAKVKEDAARCRQRVFLQVGGDQRLLSGNDRRREI